MLNSTLGSIKSKQHSGYLVKDNELELPSIHANLNRSKVRSSSSASHTNFMLEKVKWITRDSPYDSMSEAEINNEYKRLRETLKELNVEIARVLQRAQFQTIKSPERAVEPEHLIEVRSREAQNNKKMIGFYRLELAKLHKRVAEVGEDSKEVIDRDVRSTKEAIAAVRLSIKDLKKKSSALGNSILDSDGLIRQMRSLEEEKMTAETKRLKMSNDLEKVMRDLEDYRAKSSEVSEQYQRADQVLREMDQRDLGERQLKRSEMMLATKKLALESIQKKLETVRTQGQQRYLVKLKELENSVANLNKISNKINQTDKEVLEAKQLIKELEEKVRAGRHSAEDTNDNETLFLTKPLDLSYHSPSPITGRHDIDKVSDYGAPECEMGRTKRDTLGSELSRGTTVPVLKAVLSESNTVPLVANKSDAITEAAGVHEVQIGTDEYLPEEDLPEPAQPSEDLLSEKFPQAHNPPNEGPSIQEKKRRLLEKLQSFQAEDSTD